MELDLKNKKAFVTGASRGIGYEIAKTLHREGCKIAINSRNRIDLDKACESLYGSVAIEGDMRKSDEAKRVVNEVVEKLGGLDIVICNIGSGRSVEPGTETKKEWERVFGINMWSTTNTVEATRDALKKSKGVIVCISSICGVEVIEGAPITYSAAKAALNAYVKGIARPLGKEGIRINAIAPGNIIFEGSVWSKKLAEKKQETEDMLKTKVALGCFGKTSDIANLVAFLASPKSRYASGSIVIMDGGQTH